MGRLRACIAIAGVTFFVISSVVISSVQAQTVPADAITLKSSTELVLIPTVVNDKSGAHISGLRKEEFALKQDGKPHPIAIFEEVKTDSAPVHRSEGEHGTFSNFQTGGSYVPTVFFSTYLGGSGTDIITSIAVSGKAGNPTVTGYTNSTNFPIAPGAGACGGASPQPACVFQETYGGGTWDAFVTKITTQ